jgi:ssDNA-binding Zn-finger/Zn-ribbon topoisomerase 1
MKQVPDNFWFGCPKCGYKEDVDASKLKDIWSYHKIGEPCPKCGFAMTINFVACEADVMPDKLKKKTKFTLK